MIKLGVTTVHGLARPCTLLGRRRPVSLLLLEQLARTPASDLRAYDSIVDQLQLPNGTSRQTRRDRFSVLDPLTCELLRDRVDGAERLVVTDCGVSNGSTSVEWYRMLRAAFPSVDFLATDRWCRAIVVKSCRHPWAVAFDVDGAELQIIAGRLVLPGQGHNSPIYPLNRVARRLARASIVRTARTVLKRVDLDDCPDFTAKAVDDEYEVVVVPLVSGDCWRLARTDPGFAYAAHDVFTAFPRRSHVVRVMNVLTRTYFDDERLRRAFRMVLDHLLPHGIFISGRSPSADPHEVLATIFGCDDNGLEVLGRLNGGCEEESLILETAKMSRLRPDAGAA